MNHILVVDDDAGIRAALSVILGKAGYYVSTATNGEDALAQITDNKPDLLILDLMMPVMDGWEVAKRLNDDGPAALPIIVLTAADNPQQAGDLGAAEVIPKPFDVGKLLDAVQTHLSLAS